MDRIVQEVLFTDSECQSLIDGVTEWNSATLVQKGQGTEINYGYSDDSHRKASEGKYELSDSLKTMLLNKIGKWNIQGLLSTARINKYETGNYFKKHVDKTKRLYSDRLKTLIINLSNPSDFGGGGLTLYHGTEQTVMNTTRGNVIIFDSDIKHEAHTVTSGVRYTFTTWLTSHHITL